MTVGRQRGFTLLEILVVLSLLGLIAGVALPRLSSLYDSSIRSFQRDEIRRQLEQLPIRAMEQSSEIILTSQTDPSEQGDLPALPIELPNGWSIKTSQPIHFLANGVCLGGEVSLSFAGRREQWRLSPPLCQPVYQ